LEDKNNELDPYYSLDEVETAQYLSISPLVAGNDQKVKVLHYIARMQRIEKTNDFNYSKVEKKEEIMKVNERKWKKVMNTTKHDSQPMLADTSDGDSDSNDSKDLDGQMDYEDNLTYHEDSLSIMCGTVQGDKVWVVTATGSMTQLVQDSYASRIGMKRTSIRLNKQFDIKSPGGGYETIKEKVRI
jgi:hypothetical protein